ncbi:MAG: flotillin-like FloA family protein, partial [Bacteroidales bacterium]|nr:flotillin-like FloA family protein [Bacteroidales bacterium]
MTQTVFIIIGVLALLILFFWMVPLRLWFIAILNGVHVSLVQLILMRWRRVPPDMIVNSMITATKAGIKLNRDQLEAHFLAGGHVKPVVSALISAEKANIPLDFKAATAIDLAGRNVLEAIQTSVNPKVINTPPVAAVAKDGIQLIAKARVTV